jgi:hypothetical protein
VYCPPLVGILLANSAKQKAVIKLITPPTKNEMQIDGPAMGRSDPINKKKFEPILEPSP